MCFLSGGWPRFSRFSLIGFVNSPFSCLSTIAGRANLRLALRFFVDGFEKGLHNFVRYA